MKASHHYTDSLNRLIDQLAKLPGIGRRTAERLAFHLLKATEQDAMELSDAIRDVKQKVRYCPITYNLTEGEYCPIYEDPKRDQRKILVVEQPSDVITLEQAGAYDGVYHVLLGRVAPLEGVGPGDLTLGALVDRVRALSAEGDVEVILGTNPTMEGDGTAMCVAERLEKIARVRVSRLARGLPAGTQLAFANKAVLSDAITSRQKML